MTGTKNKKKRIQCDSRNTWQHYEIISDNFNYAMCQIKISEFEGSCYKDGRLKTSTETTKETKMQGLKSKKN